MDIITTRESKVRSYCRSFPEVFDKAKNEFLFNEDGKRYIDFFSGAGTLNYGHNNEKLKTALIEYIEDDRIVHGLDMATTAKKLFLQKFQDIILLPRNLDYKVQFPGPTGTNAVETALKLARMVKQRSNVISFTNGYHGLTIGSMAVTANAFYRDEAFINRADVSFMPFDGYLGKNINTAEYLRKFLNDNSSGVDLPAAIILETVQGEGGVNVASIKWLKEISKICDDFDILLIIDDIQVGNGRTGTFFSFERADIVPDIVTLSKSIGAYGLPMSLLLMKPELDQWKPGEHTGTFRGNNLAFIASATALDYWKDDKFQKDIKKKGNIINEELTKFQKKFSDLKAIVRGYGMIYGFKVNPPEMAREISQQAFENGLIIELAGAQNSVLKLLPPLIITEENLRKGLEILESSIETVLSKKKEGLLLSVG